LGKGWREGRLAGSLGGWLSRDNENLLSRRQTGCISFGGRQGEGRWRAGDRRAGAFGGRQAGAQGWDNRHRGDGRRRGMAGGHDQKNHHADQDEGADRYNPHEGHATGAALEGIFLGSRIKARFDVFWFGHL